MCGEYVIGDVLDVHVGELALARHRVALAWPRVGYLASGGLRVDGVEFRVGSSEGRRCGIEDHSPRWDWGLGFRI